MTRHSRLIILFASLVGCGDTTNTTPTQVNLDRPVDVAFSCYGGLRLTGGAPASTDQQVSVTAQPLESCNIRAAFYDATKGQKQPLPVGQEDLTAQGGAPIPAVSWFGFMLQSSTGTVAVAKWNTDASGSDNLSVLDADPLTPGVNAIAIGEDPVAIQTDSVGCFEVTANAGSCDLSVMDVTTALDAAFGAGGKAHVDRVPITNASGTPVRAKPAGMVAEPAGGVIGNMCPASATGLMYIAYPSCHAVAAVDVSSGTIVSSIRYDAGGVPTIGDGNLTCPDECGGGGVGTAGTRPVALDLQLDPRSMRRALLIGADNASSLTLVELGTDSKPLSLSQVALEDNTPGHTLGITNVKLSPQIGMGGSVGVINDDTAVGGQFQFAYGVATDGTVRVADVLTLRNGAYRECDTQVDPRFIHDIRSVRQMSCFPVGDPATPARRAGVRGPGIELGGSAVPTSIDVFKLDPPPTTTGMNPPTEGPISLIGYFGLITSTNGAVFVLNIDDDFYPDLIDPTNPLAVQLPLAIGNQLRDSIANRDQLAEDTTTHVLICNDNGVDPDAQQGNNVGGPRLTAAPTRGIPANVVAAEKANNLPSIHQVLCTDMSKNPPAGVATSELAFDAPATQRDLAYPDLKALRSDEVWTLTWEGSLSNDTTNAAVDGPAIRTGMIAVDGAGMHLRDATKPFCDAGVEQYDVVQLRGCDPTLGDTDCPQGYRCFVHPQSQVAGLGACMLTDEADRLADACKEYLTTLRRYTVYHADTGELKLLARKHVLFTTPLDGCVDDNQCKALADYAAKSSSSSNPIDDKTPADTHTWSCAVDVDRAPVTGTGKRCIETCMQDSDCIAGTACQGGYCMEGVLPPQSCVNAPQRFDVRAGEAFTVLGTKSGYLHSIVADPNGNCVKQNSLVPPPSVPASPYLVGRVPLVAPPCDPTADPRTGALPAGGFEPNPCSLTTDQYELEPVFAAPGQSCTLANPPAVLSNPARQAPGIKIRMPGITFTVVDPFYPGDALCNGDRGGTLHEVPLVFPGFQLSFRQTAGFAAEVLPIAAAFPVKVVRGPLEQAWVMDDGDVLSTTLGVPSTRGQVFRVLMVAGSFGSSTILQ